MLFFLLIYYNINLYIKQHPFSGVLPQRNKGRLIASSSSSSWQSFGGPLCELPASSSYDVSLP